MGQFIKLVVGDLWVIHLWLYVNELASLLKTVNMDRVITHFMLASWPSRCRNNFTFT